MYYKTLKVKIGIIIVPVGKKRLTPVGTEMFYGEL